MRVGLDILEKLLEAALKGADLSIIHLLAS